VELIRGIRAKVNLIALNPGPGIDFRTPAEERVLAFQEALVIPSLKSDFCECETNPTSALFSGRVHFA
jgi:adenine C2-methylase RlmN of 23S rRNA A2503 and tRNA A37